MKSSPWILCAAMLAGGASAQTLGPHQATERLQAAGYTGVREIEYDHGLWEVEARRPYGLWGDVAVDANTGDIYDARSQRARLGYHDIMKVLHEQGYVVSDLDREGAIWDAEAVDRDRRRVELRVSGYDGKVLSVEPEDWD